MDSDAVELKPLAANNTQSHPPPVPPISVASSPTLPPLTLNSSGGFKKGKKLGSPKLAKRKKRKSAPSPRKSRGFDVPPLPHPALQASASTLSFNSFSSANSEKRISPLMSPTRSGPPSPQFSPRGEWSVDGPRRFLREGTLSTVIQSFMDFPPDSETLLNFILSYRHFVTPSTLIDALKAAFSDSEEEDVARYLRLVSVVKTWIGVEYIYMSEDGPLLTKLNSFIKDISVRSDSLSNFLKTALTTPRSELDSHPVPTVHHLNPKTHKLLLDSNPLELARQLSLLEQSRLRDISIKQYHNSTWMSDPSSDLARLQRYSDKLVNFLVLQIVHETQARDQVKIWCHIVLLGKHLLSLNNFNSLLAVCGACKHFAVNRLMYHWKNDSLVPKKPMKDWQELDAIMSPKKNFAVYRSRIAGLSPPFVPALQPHLRDLVHVTESSKNFLDPPSPTLVSSQDSIPPPTPTSTPSTPQPPILNLQKLDSMGKVISIFYSSHLVRYNFTIESDIYREISLTSYNNVELSTLVNEKFDRLSGFEPPSGPVSSTPGDSSHSQPTSRSGSFSGLNFKISADLESPRQKFSSSDGVVITHHDSSTLSGGGGSGKSSPGGSSLGSSTKKSRDDESRSSRGHGGSSKGDRERKSKGKNSSRSRQKRGSGTTRVRGRSASPSRENAARSFSVDQSVGTVQNVPSRDSVRRSGSAPLLPRPPVASNDLEITAESSPHEMYDYIASLVQRLEYIEQSIGLAIDEAPPVPNPSSIPAYLSRSSPLPHQPPKRRFSDFEENKQKGNTSTPMKKRKSKLLNALSLSPFSSKPLSGKRSSSPGLSQHHRRTVEFASAYSQSGLPALPEAYVPLTMVGKKSCGRNSILNRLMTDSFSPSFAKLSISNFIDINSEKIQLSCPLGQYSELEKVPSLKRSAGIVFVYDLTNLDSIKEAESYLESATMKSKKLPLLLLGNKTDLPAERVVSRKDGLILAKKFDATFYEVSAKNGHNVIHAFEKFLAVIGNTSPTNKG
eukprot:TRINITY_DN8892_c0_g1_i1.p1 TRINITY_DN8892_c0_g1~~TRINITY_DN8892_c0_g1_i1.p1  ORF type:complete len:1010 (+),score=183.96 TRINITY_DN8892_c0_g1_i1:82-3111(+)